ncbi:MAG TPA: His-Xaa-Ser system protein HxsD [Terriglobales bacterium]|nr:His-Xaa-Ser system protein HxsD [Terriglobales bacterium]
MTSVVTFSLKAFGLDAIKKAAYRFSDVISVEITPHENEVICSITFVGKLSIEETEQILAAFRTEVLDQDLRTVVASETTTVRNAILAYALSKTGLQASE